MMMKHELSKCKKQQRDALLAHHHTAHLRISGWERDLARSNRAKQLRALVKSFDAQQHQIAIDARARYAAVFD